jgi:hypothetical protein
MIAPGRDVGAGEHEHLQGQPVGVRTEVRYRIIARAPVDNHHFIGRPRLPGKAVQQAPDRLALVQYRAYDADAHAVSPLKITAGIILLKLHPSNVTATAFDPFVLGSHVFVRIHTAH